MFLHPPYVHWVFPTRPWVPIVVTTIVSFLNVSLNRYPWIFPSHHSSSSRILLLTDCQLPVSVWSYWYVSSTVPLVWDGSEWTEGLKKVEPPVPSEGCPLPWTRPRTVYLPSSNPLLLSLFFKVRLFFFLSGFILPLSKSPSDFYLGFPEYTVRIFKPETWVPWPLGNVSTDGTSINVENIFWGKRQRISYLMSLHLSPVLLCPTTLFVVYFPLSDPVLVRPPVPLFPLQSSMWILHR